MINGEIISKLFNVCEDEDEIELILSCIRSFNEYHNAIYDMESFLRFGYKDMSTDEYKDTLMTLDNRRTNCHNVVITNIRILNRLAETHNLEPIYTGIVSEERPHRRILANEVLEYVEHIIKERR